MLYEIININSLFRCFLTFSSTSLLLIVYAVQNGYSLGRFFEGAWVAGLPNSVSYVIYLFLAVLLTRVCIGISKYLGKDEFKAGEVVSIEYANNSFLPSYLGYFFVGLSISSSDTLWFVYGIVFVFTFVSQALYFNPLFLLCGFNFYNVTTKNGTTIFLISPKRYKKPDDIDIPVVYRINNYTFIERI